MRKPFILLILTALVITAIPFAKLRADTITLTLVVSDLQRDLLTDAVLKGFEDTHPGVKVNVTTRSSFIGAAANDISKHLDDLQEYVSAGDVVYVDSNNISPEATNAGYFLDLLPLISGDKSLNVDDFYPAAWRAFQWDKGFWAMPVAADPIILTYDPEAFDKAGVPYPNDKWTVDDLADAARKLTQKDANGKILVSGMDLFPGLTGRVLLGSLVSGSLFDASAIPNVPHLATPEAEKVLTTWAKLDEEGLLGQDLGKAPLSIGSAFVTSFQNAPNKKRQTALLPGGKAGLDVQGFAVSAGTQHPEQAYALALYLTTRPEVASRFALSSARRNLTTSTTGNQAVGPKLPSDIKPILDEALTNGYTLADLRYNDYLLLAFQKIKSDKLDAHAALQLVETQAVKNQQTALDRKGKTAIVVATPVPAVQQPGKSTLKFSLTTPFRPLPNQDKWDALMQDFAAHDPQIGKVNLTLNTKGFEDAVQQYDCVMLPFNAVPGAKLDGLLNLDPFLSADPSFDKADMVGNIMNQVQRDGKTWALPISLEPTLMKYNTDLFSKAGLPAPTANWTISDFVNVLKTLKPTTDGAVFDPSAPGGQYLLMLIAAYGSLPLDYRTDPLTANLTDPATVDAIRQVLDLAKDGYIKYEALGNVGTVLRIGKAPSAPLIAAGFGGLRIKIGSGTDPYKSVLYPKGSKYSVLSYSINTAYISAKAQNPDACYRWISQIAHHPELFSTMPARRSLINDPATTAAQSADITGVYTQIDTLLKDPNTIAFPSMFQGGQSQAGFLIEHWVFEAFDAYVLNNGDLESALKQAAVYIEAFHGCIAQIPPYDPSSGQNARDYGKQYLNCGVKVDSRLQSFVDGLKGG